MKNTMNRKMPIAKIRQNVRRRLRFPKQRTGSGSCEFYDEGAAIKNFFYFNESYSCRSLLLEEELVEELAKLFRIL